MCFLAATAKSRGRWSQPFSGALLCHDLRGLAQAVRFLTETTVHLRRELQIQYGHRPTFHYDQGERVPSRSARLNSSTATW